MSEAMLRLFVTTTAWVQDRYNGRKDRGATAVEYGLLVGLIAVLLIAGLGVLGPHLRDLFSNVGNQIPAGDGADAGAGA